MKTVYTLFLFFSISCFGQAQNSEWPTLEEVSMHFFEHYEPFQPSHNYFNFERHPDGYYIALLNTDRSIKARALLYSFEKQSFEKINLCPERGQSTDSTPVSTDHLNEHNNYWRFNSYHKQGFDLHPFYGYMGWYHDVIALYEKESELTNYQLHALARAYQYQISAFFSNNSGLALPSDKLDLPTGAGNMNEAQLAKFMEIHHKRLAVYQELVERDPLYKTPIGPVTTKYANEVMDGYLLLAYNQNEATAKQLIEENLYYDYLLKTARNILRSCPKNAILYTWGDTDTYSLNYLQITEGFRTDVIVANTALLSVPKYFKYIYDGPLGAKNIATSFPDTFFKKLHVLSANALSDSPAVHIDDWYTSINVENKIGVNNPSDIIYLDISNKINVPIPSNAPVHKGSSADTIQINIDRHFPNDKATPLDILYSNNWQRPICFSLTCRVNLWALWEGYVVHEGLVNTIYADKQAPVTYKNTPFKATMNANKTYHLWMNDFEWNTTQHILNYDLGPYHQIYTVTGYQLINQLIIDGDTTRALTVLHTLPKKFPNEIAPWGVTWANIFRLAVKLEDHNLATQIAVKVLENYKAEILSDFDQRFKPQVIADFKRFVQDHPSEDLSNLLKDIGDY